MMESLQTRERIVQVVAVPKIFPGCQPFFEARSFWLVPGARPGKKGLRVLYAHTTGLAYGMQCMLSITQTQ